jgi:hypothetical protein
MLFLYRSVLSKPTRPSLRAVDVRPALVALARQFGVWVYYGAGTRCRRGALVLLAVMAVGPAGCAGREEAPVASGWQHTRTTEGDVTTVSTTDGSQWGGPAILEEELSIGVAAGDEPYMFGQVASVWATDDAIWVVDRTVPAVRVYDHQGTWLRDIGGAGQGPGEYEAPTQVVVTDDGRIIVADMSRRTNIYDASGTALATWNAASRGGVFIGISGGSLLLRDDGSLWTRTAAMPTQQQMQQGGTLRIPQGMAPLDQDGAQGELVEPPAIGGQDAAMEMRTAGSSGGGMSVSMTSGPGGPFAPSYVWAMAPNGDWVVGAAESYRFEIHHAAGGRTIVERYWDPVPVLDEEAAYFVERTERSRQRFDPEYRYDGPPAPASKPAYSQLAVDRDGRIWVQRQGTGYRIPGCEDDDGTQTATSGGGGRVVMTTSQPCWSSRVIRDVFDASGDYLGEVIAPEGLSLGATYIRDDLFLVVAEDEEGLVMVKKYRIVPASSPTD